MARSKRASVTRRSTPASVIPHTARRKLRHQRHLNLKQKHASTTQRREDDLEDTYVSLLRSIHDAEDDDDASSDGTDINASSDDQLEEWDEDAALVEMLGSPYLMPFFYKTFSLIKSCLANTTKNTSSRSSAAFLRTLPMACVRR